MDKLPLVTIGIPNFNYSRFINECLDSVAKQTYENIEIIIVDDCSMDNSREIIDNWINNYAGEFKIRFIKNEVNQGLTKVCNIILKNAEGKYFQILDADDIIDSDKISRQTIMFDKLENTAMVYSNMKLINEAGEVIVEDYLHQIGYDELNMPQGNVFLDLFDFNFIAYPLIKTQTARDVGGFDDSQQVHDYYLWLKLLENYEVIYCPGKFSSYRIHGSSMSNNPETSIVSIENVLMTKFRYLKNGNKEMKAIIKRDIYNSSPSLYKYKLPTTALWLKRNMTLNPGVKSAMYYLGYYLGIPFSLFESVKNVINKVRPGNE